MLGHYANVYCTEYICIYFNASIWMKCIAIFSGQYSYVTVHWLSQRICADLMWNK